MHKEAINESEFNEESVNEYHNPYEKSNNKSPKGKEPEVSDDDEYIYKHEHRNDLDYSTNNRRYYDSTTSQPLGKNYFIKISNDSTPNDYNFNRKRNLNTNNNDYNSYLENNNNKNNNYNFSPKSNNSVNIKDSSNKQRVTPRDYSNNGKGIPLTRNNRTKDVSYSKNTINDNLNRESPKSSGKRHNIKSYKNIEKDIVKGNNEYSNNDIPYNNSDSEKHSDYPVDQYENTLNTRKIFKENPYDKYLKPNESKNSSKPNLLDFKSNISEEKILLERSGNRKEIKRK